jgi:hypothetical protein
MDLSHWGQSRDAEGRHRAARPGLGPWDGARVASPRCPILRPGSSSVLGTTATRQFRAGSPAGKTGRGIRLGSRAWARRMSKGPYPRRIGAVVRGSTYCVLRPSHNCIFVIRRIVRERIAVI